MTSQAPTVPVVLRAAEAELARSGILAADVDAELLVGHVLGLGRGEVQAAGMTERRMLPAEAQRIGQLVLRRATREPLQHITGVAGFRSLELRVGPGVFVPRPETEQVTQIAIDALQAVPDPEPIAIDLGTGSGAIALALATEVPTARVFAVENSVDAFLWATENARRVGAPNATFVFDDLGSALPEWDGTAALVISNPPYVPAEAVPVDPEVRFFDPPAALYGGEDGLDVVRALSRSAARLLRPGGTLVIEHGELQGDSIRSLLAADGWRAPATFPDFTMRDRATTAIRA
ncbi:peptide chain release factor N(5)-glutamine methyltransferase [Microbacterium sp. MPKO10]|uniref:peptide chain release factor N(5)-glutamine methyltransferase n=1 Tax=Microbacterium sp. MPKO10 TaxID=2989818 RepID=UPI00223576C9|nr:peptide chain release factor N(5)-glutamine methyltransferase [Microbacterium sp. MPKO10]MCW4458380.1 peptide chain release factor N(5)-glutamine methyltransferase [Microbacterium sp. MPKO10]